MRDRAGREEKQNERQSWQRGETERETELAERKNKMRDRANRKDKHNDRQNWQKEET